MTHNTGRFASVLPMVRDANEGTRTRFIGFASSFPASEEPPQSQTFSLRRLAEQACESDAQETNADAQQLTELQQEVRMVTHDMNNVLTLQFGLIDILNLESHTLDLKIIATNLREATERIATLSLKLAQLAKRERPKKIWLDVYDTLHETTRLCLLQTNIQSEIDVHLPWPIFIDPVEFGRIIQNLIINARQAMPDGGKLFIKTSNLQDEECAMLKILIRDQGSGIPETDLKHIFEFHYTTKPQGQGLGLAYVKRAIKRFGGTISVTSKVNYGTEFSLFFPALPRPF